MKALQVSFPKLIIITLAIASIVFFLSYKWVNYQWRYNIASDGKGYYIYLPAAFIYQDFSFEFTQQTEAKYYDDSQPPVVQLPDDKKLNKYFAGEAILLIPFFLIAHLLSFILGVPTDGYSFFYQASVSVAAVFYALAGLLMMSKYLKHFIVSENVITFVLILTFGGSTLLHYTWMEPSMSHVYSFFVINAFIALAAAFFISHRKTTLFLLFAILGIICLIRPVNILIILALPFIWMMLKNKTSIKNLIQSKPIFLLGLLLFLMIVFIQLIFYKLQIGQWWIWAYHQEGFNFSKPHFFDFIFSFRKGWLIYTPIAFISLITAVYLWRNNLKILLSYFTPLIIILYVASSWHDWAYGAGYGSRPMTEYIGFALIPLAIYLEQIKNEVQKAIIIFFTWCFLLINCVHIYQINKHILLLDNMTFKAYKASFLKTSDEYINMLE
jgi:hypothetical protein